MTNNLSDELFEEIKEYSQLADKLIKHKIFQKYKISEITGACDNLSEKLQKLKYSVEFNSFNQTVKVSEKQIEHKFKYESLFYILCYLFGNNFKKKNLNKKE